MDHTLIPPGSREVRTGELGDELTMRIVANIGQTVDTLTLRQLISGDQLAVSVDGQSSAHVVTFRRGAELVVHSELGVLKPRFERLRPDVGTRILRMEADSLLVWGKVDGHPSGLWRLDQGEGTFLAPLDRLLRGPSGLLRGSVDGSPEMSVVTSWGGLWPVGHKTLVSPFRGGLSVVEELGGVLHAYELNENGEISPFQMLTLQDAERPVGIVHWCGRLLLAVARGSQSWLVELNRKSSSETPVRIQIDGDLLGVWSSPRSETLLSLVHPRGEPDDVRRLQLDDGQVVYEGRFEIDPASVVWSPSENAVAVKIRESQGFGRVLHERIVGTGVDHAIALGLHLREYLIDDAGAIAAAIRHDGVYDQPIIGGQVGTQVPLAWNLHYTQKGGIAWTTVHGDRIITWTQQRR
ncbi:MAG: hypothetical protein AAB413_01485 [Patescibacteria group bacterium]